MMMKTTVFAIVAQCLLVGTLCKPYFTNEELQQNEMPMEEVYDYGDVSPPKEPDFSMEDRVIKDFADALRRVLEPQLSKNAESQAIDVLKLEELLRQFIGSGYWGSATNGEFTPTKDQEPPVYNEATGNEDESDELNGRYPTMLEETLPPTLDLAQPELTQPDETNDMLDDLDANKNNNYLRNMDPIPEVNQDIDNNVINQDEEDNSNMGFLVLDMSLIRKKRSSQDRYDTIDSFLAELDKDIARNPPKIQGGIYGDSYSPSKTYSDYSSRVRTTTERSFWQRFSDKVSSTYQQAKQKTKDAVKTIRM